MTDACRNAVRGLLLTLIFACATSPATAALPACTDALVTHAAKCAPYPERDAQSGKYGYRGADGQWLVQPTFKSAQPFHSGRAMVTLDRAEQLRASGGPPQSYKPCTYLKLDGSALASVYSSCGAFTGTFAYIEATDASFGMIDRNGLLVVPYAQRADWRRSTAGMSEGLLALRDSETGKVGYVDATGAWLIKPQFANGFEHRNGLAAVTAKDGGKVGFIDRTGRLQIGHRFGTNFGAPPVFSEGLALLSKDDYWPLTNLDPPARLGFIDRQGNWKIAPQFSGGFAFDGGVARVNKGDKEYYVDRTGKVARAKK